MASIITGLFKSPAEAARAVNNLEREGVPSKQISLLASDDFVADAFGIEKTSKAPEGAAVGGATGGALGALAAGLTAVGVIGTGGLGLVAAGPILATLAGAGAGAAAGGALGGAIGAGIPEHQIHHYEDSLKEGSVLVGVHCEDGDDKDRAKTVFETCEAKDIATA